MSGTGLYTKNVPPFERVLRIFVALMAIGVALFILPAPSSYLAAAGAVGFSLTGFFGFCPACAMIGRKI